MEPTPRFFKSAYVPGKYPVDVQNYNPLDYTFAITDRGNFAQALGGAWMRSLGGLFEASGKSPAQVKNYFAHQVDSTKNREVALACGIPETSFLNTFKEFGNMGCPTIFINYRERLLRSGFQSRPGDLTVFQGVGGGLSWASLLLEHK